MCCVFWPANGCSACRSLVEINFLMLQQLFPSISAIKCLKNAKNYKKHVIKGGLPAFRCYSLKLVDCIFLWGFPFFFLFLLVMEKYKKTCCNAKTNDFDHQTACRAPVPWSKYTTDMKMIFGRIGRIKWDGNEKKGNDAWVRQQSRRPGHSDPNRKAEKIKTKRLKILTERPNNKAENIYAPIC